MTDEDRVWEILTKCGAILEGHFELSSGLHSDKYIQCAQALQYPRYGEDLGKMIAARFRDKRVQVVIGPALGGIIIAYEVARALGARALFAERAEHELTLRRLFRIQPGDNVLVVEDVVTTGTSAQEVAKLATDLGGRVVGIGAIVDRTVTPLDPGVEFRALVKIEARTYPPDSCPLCQRGIPIVKPGSKPPITAGSGVT